jgi:dynein heavy chain, axonemal
LYEKNKLEPLLSRNLPPISGRIAWSRQLYRRITNPIKKLASRADVLKSEEGKIVVRNYNKMAQVLLEYEVYILRLTINYLSISITMIE